MGTEVFRGWAAVQEELQVLPWGWCRAFVTALVSACTLLAGAESQLLVASPGEGVCACFPSGATWWFVGRPAPPKQHFFHGGRWNCLQSPRVRKAQRSSSVLVLLRRAVLVYSPRLVVAARVACKRSVSSLQALGWSFLSGCWRGPRMSLSCVPVVSCWC